MLDCSPNHPTQPRFVKGDASEKNSFTGIVPAFRDEIRHLPWFQSHHPQCGAERVNFHLLVHASPPPSKSPIPKPPNPAPRPAHPARRCRFARAKPLAADPSARQDLHLRWPGTPRRRAADRPRGSWQSRHPPPVANPPSTPPPPSFFPPRRPPPRPAPRPPPPPLLSPPPPPPPPP